MDPSIPVMKEGPISAGKVVAAGSLGAGTDGVEGPGASNDIAAMASWSSIVNDGKRRDMSLHYHELTYVVRIGKLNQPSVFVTPAIANLQLSHWISNENKFSQMLHPALSP